VGFFDRFSRKPQYNPKTGFEVATGLSKKILQTAVNASEQLKIGLQQYSEPEVAGSSATSEDDESPFLKLSLEFTFLFLHVTDRTAFQVFESENRGDFMDQLVGITFETITEICLHDSEKSVKDEFSASLLSTLNQKNTFYGSCKIVSEKQESLENTLFWEFGKAVAETLGRSMDLAVIMTAIEIGSETFKILNIKQVLEGACD